MTDFRVVTPDDMGNSIKLGIKEANKYDVDIAQLDIPEQVTGVSLQGTQLTLETIKGEKTVDLAPMLPKIVADVFLKNVQRQDNQIAFTVGIKADTSQDTTFTIDIADLIPVHTDNATIMGNGVNGNSLRVQLSQDTASHGINLLKQSSNGLYVGTADVVDLITSNNPSRDVRLVNASGQITLGYLHSTEK